MSLIAHEFRGERGEVVLLLNGGMMTYRSWAPVADGLLDRWRLLGCDFRGQLLTPVETGAGERPLRGPTLDDHLADLLALLDAIGLEAVHVLGTSFGAEIGLLLAAREPGRVRSLAAVTAVDVSPPSLRKDAERLSELVHEVLDGGDRDLFHQHLTESIYSRGWVEQNRDLVEGRRAAAAALPRSWYEGLLPIAAVIADFDLRPDLERIRCPVLVVHGAADTVMPEARVRGLAEAIPGAEFAVHPEAGHALVVEDPDWLAATYRAFLERRGRAAGAAS